MTVQALKAGPAECVTKRSRDQQLLDAVQEATHPGCTLRLELAVLPSSDAGTNR